MDSNSNRPTPEVRIKEVTVFVDPFDDFLQQKRREENQDLTTTNEDDLNDDVDDQQVTWTGKRVRGPGTSSQNAPSGVGKYLQAALADRDEDEIIEYVDEDPEPEPARKKAKGTGGFGDFSSW